MSRLLSFRGWLEAIALILVGNNIVTSGVALVFSLSFSCSHGLDLLAHRLNRGWLGLSGWLILTSATGFAPGIAVTGLFNFLPFFLFGAIAKLLLHLPAAKLRLINLLNLGSIGVGVLAVVQVGINRPDWQLPRLFSSYVISLGMSPDHRITSWFGHFNELAIYSLLMLPLSWFLLHHGTKPQKIMAGLGLGLSLFSLYHAGSRNAWLLGGVGLGAIAWRWGYGWITGAVVMIMGLTLGAVAFNLDWFPPDLLSRLQSSFDPNLPGFSSTGDRWHAWQFAWNLIGQRPILGWGLRSFALLGATMGYDLRGLPHEHNFYLLLAVGAGLPGLCAYVGLMVVTAWQEFRVNLDRQLADLRFCRWLAIILFMLFGLVDVPFYEPRVHLLFWLILAL
ncbi:MAG: O-antigen ligase family protein [Pseudanabaenaceae cyanobacterium bins.68]|nr:O-antigen ligase family protein [Pseudanabaenaceae cyanobacterium bins.68]